MKSSLKKLLLAGMLLVSGAIFAAKDSIGDCIKQVDRWLKSEYSESPRAYEYESKKLNRILGAAKSDEEKIAEMKKEFPRAFQKEEKPLIVQQPLSWNIHSLSLGYDITEGATATVREVDVLKELESQKDSSERSTSEGKISSHHTGFGIGGDAGINWMNKEATTQANVKISGSYAYGRDSVNKTNEMWSKSRQKTFSREQSKISEMLQQKAVKNRHLTFALTLTNNTDEPMTFELKDAYIPVAIGPSNFPNHAYPQGKYGERIVIEERGHKTINFRMELDTTSALNLAKFLGYSTPTIGIMSGVLNISSKRYPNVIAACRKHIDTRPVKLKLPGFYAEWNIRSKHTSDSRPVTPHEALNAIDDDIHSGWRHHILTWKDNALSAISDIPIGFFAADDKEERYLAFLQVGDKIHPKVPADLLDLTLWGVDLDNLDYYKDVSKPLRQAVFDKVKKLAEAPNGKAMHKRRLGIMLFIGFYGGADAQQAAEWYRKAALQNDAMAEFLLGEYYKLVEKDLVLAKEWFKQAAKQGYAPAQNSLGLYYKHENNYISAAKWFEKAAKQGLKEAQKNLGDCYYFGKGKPQSYEKAVEWYQKAAEQGYAEAQDNLGCCYEYGKGVYKDYQRAYFWYRKSAEQGYAIAQKNFGACYYFGKGTPQSYEKAAEWFEKAAKQGHAEAQDNLGCCYEYGKGVTKDYELAYYWYRKSAEQGYAVAQYNLGVCYEYGKGTPTSYEKAVEWYTKSANQGYAEAQYHIRRIKSAKFNRYLRDAEKGDRMAQYQVGLCYWNGDGVEKDRQKALKWFSEAADNPYMWSIMINMPELAPVIIAIKAMKHL